MKYHLCKKSRIYSGLPYRGLTSFNTHAEFDSLKDAEKAVHEFTRRNPVGWDIYNSETGVIVLKCCLCENILSKSEIEDNKDVEPHDMICNECAIREGRGIVW